jgi:hypothetical protein
MSWKHQQLASSPPAYLSAFHLLCPHQERRQENSVHTAQQNQEWGKDVTDLWRTTRQMPQCWTKHTQDDCQPECGRLTHGWKKWGETLDDTAFLGGWVSRCNPTEEPQVTPLSSPSSLPRSFTPYMMKSNQNGRLCVSESQAQFNQLTTYYCIIITTVTPYE